MPATQAVAKPSYTHAAMVDLLVQNPMITQGDIARHFGYTEGWVSQVLRADAIRELIAARRNELLDPVVLQGLEKRLEALAHQSLEVLQTQLQLKPSADVALKALELSSRALGYGAKDRGAQIVQNFVVAMPEKSIDGDDWVARHHPARPSLGLGGGAPSQLMAQIAMLTVDTMIDG